MNLTVGWMKHPDLAIKFKIVGALNLKFQYAVKMRMLYQASAELDVAVQY
jgi:hypothetical protein